MSTTEGPHGSAPAQPSGRGGPRLWPSLRSYLRPHRPQLALVGLLMLASVAAELAKPWPMKFVIDYLTASEGGSPASKVPLPESARASVGAFLAFAAAIVLGFAVIDAVVGYMGTVARARLGSQVGLDIRRDTFAKLQRLGLDFHFSRRSGELTTRVVGDTAQIDDFVSDRAPSLVEVAATFVAMVALMFWLDWRLALVSTVVIPPAMFFVITRFVEAIKDRSKLHRAETGNLNALTQETLQSIQVVKAFSREDFTDDMFARQNRSTRQAHLATVRVEGSFVPTIQIMVQVGVVMILAFGVLRVRAGVMSTGDLWVFLSYFRAMRSPLKDLSNGLRQLARTEVRWERISEILSLAADDEGRDLRPAPPLLGRVELRGVHFTYPTERASRRRCSAASTSGSSRGSASLSSVRPASARAPSSA